MKAIVGVYGVPTQAQLEKFEDILDSKYARSRRIKLLLTSSSQREAFEHLSEGFMERQEIDMFEHVSSWRKHGLQADDVRDDAVFDISTLVAVFVNKDDKEATIDILRRIVESRNAVPSVVI